MSDLVEPRRQAFSRRDSFTLSQFQLFRLSAHVRRLRFNQFPFNVNKVYLINSFIIDVVLSASSSASFFQTEPLCFVFTDLSSYFSNPVHHIIDLGIKMTSCFKIHCDDHYLNSFRVLMLASKIMKGTHLSDERDLMAIKVKKLRYLQKVKDQAVVNIFLKFEEFIFTSSKDMNV